MALCLWVLIVFSILAAGLYQIVATQLRLAKVLEERAVSRYLAKAACTYFMSRKNKDETSHDTLFELSEKPEKLLGRGKFTYSIKDEQGRININTASPEVLARLPGLNPELAKAIAISPLKPFAAIEELLTVEGFNEQIYSECREFITVYSNGRVNINTAGSEVLSALGLPATLVAKIDEFRNGPDAETATEDDGVFISNEALLTFASLTAAEKESINKVLIWLIASSENFCINVDTYFLGKHAFAYSITISKDKIKRWSER